MSFLFLMAIAALSGWLIGRVFRRPIDLRDAMRIGAAGAFVFTGCDHFISGESRYLPMMPGFFGELALPLVWFTGAAEIAGAIGLLVPSSVYRRLGLPHFRRWVGVALAVMLAFLVTANINVAIKGGGIAGLGFGQWYFWLRPIFQPFIIAWVLYSAGVIWRQAQAPTASSHA